jgi:sigma-B regulation protein RsbU (phosphoserine phosphatase)
MLGEYLGLFASTEIFIYVFMEIVTKIETIQHVIFKKAEMRDYAVFVVIFGLFSIFGTYIGIPGKYGAISNIRDLAPMVAGLVAGPYVGIAVGLIGGMHRLFLGGDSAVACSLATVLAGLIAGLVYKYNNEKLIGIIPAMVFAIGIELLHASLALALVNPFTEAVDIVVTDIPAMIVANSLGLAISVIVIHSTRELKGQSDSG